MFRIERADAEMPAAVRTKFFCSQGVKQTRSDRLRRGSEPAVV